MEKIKNYIFIVIQIMIVIAGLEIGTRLLFPNKQSEFQFNYSKYSKIELDKSIPISRDENGGKCVDYKKKFSWNQWWGYSERNLDFSCAQQLFKNKSLKIVFMGGSAMANAEAPNYLSHVEFYATQNLKDFASINLAESGARHKNMSIRFQREVIPLSPDIVIFLDGFNEFNSIRYGGKPSDDFYWTAGVKDRVHSPYRLYIDKLVEVSKLAETALIRTGIYNSARLGKAKISDKEIAESADQYIADMQITKNLCEAYQIKCLFILQPHVFNSTNNEHLKIIEHAESIFPGFKKSIQSGYKLIELNCFDCVNATNLLNNSSNTFIDPVHFEKEGGKMLGAIFYNLIKTFLNEQNYKKNN